MLPALSAFSQQFYQPSPNSVALGRFVDVPVNLYAGIPDIRIPIGEFKTRNASIPIDLRYHASGVRVEDVSSWVGANWSLNAGGTITRVVRGLPDESPYGFCGSATRGGAEVADYYTATNNGNPIVTFKGNPVNEYYEKVSKEELDAEQDIFYFNVNGSSGTFYLNKDGYAVLIPSSNIRIIPAIGPRGTGTWEIQTHDGVRYLFPDTSYYTETSEVSADPSDRPPYSFVSTWHLSQIVQLNTVETIHFSYATDAEIVNETFSQTHYHYDYTDSYEEYDYVEYRTYNEPHEGMWHEKLEAVRHTVKILNPKRLTKIECGSWQYTDKIEFIPESTARKDLPGNYALKSVVFTDTYTGRVYKTVHLGYRYYTAVNDSYNAFPAYPENHRLFLTRVHTQNGEEATSPYLLEYDNSVLLPNRFYNFEQDYWGYYSKNMGYATIRDQSGTIISTTQFNNIPQLDGLTGMDRKGNPAYMGALALKKIVYPRGASTSFEFEAHTAGNYDFPIGGLRIKRKIDREENSPAMTTTDYSYTIPNTTQSSGYLIALPKCLYNRQIRYRYSVNLGTGVSWFVKTFVYRVRTNRSLVDLGTTQGHVGYKYVTVTVNGGTSSGKTVYEYTTREDVPDLKVVRGAQGYYDAEYVEGAGVQESEYTPRVNKDFFRGVLRKESQYDASGNTKSITEYHYSLDEPETLGGKLYSLRVTSDLTYLDILAPHNGPSVANHHYQGRLYYIQREWLRLDSASQHTYDDNGNAIAAVTRYTFNRANQQPSRITSVNSAGDTITRYRIYATDYADSRFGGIGGPGVEPRQTFIWHLGEANMRTTLIEEVVAKTKNGMEYILDGTINTYELQEKETEQNVPYSFPAPKESYRLEIDQPVPLASFKFSNASQGSMPGGSSSSHYFEMDEKYGLTSQVNRYDDFGSPEEVTDGRITSAVIYGYKSRYPVARINNAGRADVAYYGFEDGLFSDKSDDGRWIWWSQSPEIVDAGDNPHHVYAGDHSLRLKAGYSGIALRLTNGLIPDRQHARYRVSLMVKGIPYSSLQVWMSAFKEGEPVTTLYPNIAEAFRMSSVQNTGEWKPAVFEFDLGEIRQLGQVPSNERLGILLELGNLSASPGHMYLDEIRIAPVDAVVETASYEPAIGVTCGTDARYRSSFYEYDDLGRISRIRDNDRNMLRQYEYYDRNSYLNSQWIIGPVSGMAPTLTFTAQQSAGSGDYDKTFHWDFGDGTSHSGTSATVTHFFDAPAIYRVKLTVKDSKGNIVGTPDEVSVNTQ